MIDERQRRERRQEVTKREERKRGRRGVSGEEVDRQKGDAGWSKES